MRCAQPWTALLDGAALLAVAVHRRRYGWADGCRWHLHEQEMASLCFGQALKGDASLGGMPECENGALCRRGAGLAGRAALAARQRGKRGSVGSEAAWAARQRWQRGSVGSGIMLVAKQCWCQEMPHECGDRSVRHGHHHRRPSLPSAAGTCLHTRLSTRLHTCPFRCLHMSVQRL